LYSVGVGFDAPVCLLCSIVGLRAINNRPYGCVQMGITCGGST